MPATLMPETMPATSFAKPSLRWATALRIAVRELVAARGKFVFVVLSVAIGVGALTGVRGFATSFSDSMLGQARSILAADLTARMSRTLRPDEQLALQQFAVRHHAEMTRVVEMGSMATVAKDPVPLLIALKIVDPAKYPFYGAVRLSNGQPLASTLRDDTVVVDENLLVRLRAQVGDSLRIGGHWFRIAALIVQEPDRLSAGVGLGPRVMMTTHALDAIGLLQPGSRATERFLFRLAPADVIAPAHDALEHVLPEAQVADFREGAPELTRGLDQARSLLSLICLVAMVLGAIGVGMAMRAHLQQRIDGIAIMKAMGARSGDVLRIYTLETLLLGLAGAMVGVLLGLGVEWVLPQLIGSLLPLRPSLHLPWLPVLGALSTGVLTTMLFSLPPLLQIRDVRPSVVLRRLVDTPREGNRVATLLRSLRAGWVQVVVVGVILVALAVIAAWLSDSWKGGTWFAGSLAFALVALLAMSAGILRLLRAALDRTRLALPSSLRHGLANLYRPGNQSAAVLAALGVGVMLVLSVFLMQRSIVATMDSVKTSKTPNVFLVDIAPAELDGVRTLALQQAGPGATFEALPILTGTLDSLDGAPLAELQQHHFQTRLRRTMELTWSAQPPDGITILQGNWWKPGDTQSIAVVDRDATHLHLHLGSRLTFTAGGRQLNVAVRAIYRVDGQHISARTEFIFAPGVFEGASGIWYAAVRMPPERIATLEAAMFAAYPTVTAINIADILTTIERVVSRVTLVIRFLAGFSILSGMVILASSVASTRYRRVREVVVLKALGATRNRIAAVFSVEFAVLGLLAGVAGMVFAQGLTRILLHQTQVLVADSKLADAVAVAATAVLAVFTGWLASYRILGQKPLEVLREE